MNPTQLTSAHFHTWLRAPPRYSVLMVKMNDCVPCGRVTPIFNKYSRDWSENKDVQFGMYSIDWNDRFFIESVLQVKATPTFQVYDGETKVLTIVSAKRVYELKDFLQSRSPLRMIELE